jgi:hypothetical protein
MNHRFLLWIRLTSVIGALFVMSRLRAGDLGEALSDLVGGSLGQAGNYTNESNVGKIERLDISICSAPTGYQDDYLIFEVICSERKFRFPCPLKGNLPYQIRSPEQAVANVQLALCQWQAYYAARLRDKDNPLGAPALRAVVLIDDGDYNKKNSGFVNGFVRLRLEVYTISGINKGQVMEDIDAFTIPIESSEQLGTVPPKLVATFPIGVEGLRRHSHINVNIYHGP